MTRLVRARMVHGLWRLWIALLLGMGAVLSPAPADAVTLKWAAQNDVMTLDPHAQNHTVTSAILQHAYEGLVRYDREFQIEPALATGWTMQSPTDWRFTLRKGVKFHDGSPFSAEDVLFSFERLKESNSSMTVNINGIKEVRKVDDSHRRPGPGTAGAGAVEKPDRFPHRLQGMGDQEQVRKGPGPEEQGRYFRLAQCQRHRFLPHPILGTGTAGGDGEAIRPGGTRSPATSTRSSTRRSSRTRPGSQPCFPARWTW